MSYNNIADGIYIIKKNSEKLGSLIDHYGIVDIGNLFNHPQSDGSHPIVYEQVFPKIELNWLRNTGTWKIVSRIKNEYITQAKQRLNKAFLNPEYDLFENNCEHFARYVVEGEKYSTQLQSAVLVAGLAVLTYFIFKD